MKNKINFNKFQIYFNIACFVCIPFLGIMLITPLPYIVVGTGVTVCYNNTTTITCPTNPNDPFYGQNQGLTPSYQNNNNGTITDLNTELTWIKARGTKISWDSAFIMAAQCNTGGFTDWRVPTIKELYSLINFNGKSGIYTTSCIPYIDTNFFGWKTGDTSIGERVIDAQDWSATKYKGLTMVGDSTIFGVNFVDGRIKGYPQYKPGTGLTEKQRMYVRFVRGNTAYGINNFVDNGDSTITDNATGLMWSKNDSREGMNWQNALSWVQTKNSTNYLGHNDWRLPYAKELQSIIDYTRCKDYTNSAAISPVFNISSMTDEGGSLNWPFFWSNTTHKDNMGGVYVAFGEALGWMKIPPNATYYTLYDVHGAGAQRSDPKSGSYLSYFLGYNQNGQPVYGLGPQGDVIRINNYVRLVRTAFTSIGINNQGSEIPTTFTLYQNYPNPFNPSTIIRYDLPESGFVQLIVFDALGREVKKLVNEKQNAGIFNITFDGSNLPSGVYFYRIAIHSDKLSIKQSGSSKEIFYSTKKLVLIK
jgi:hypothetical protein